MNWSVRGFWKHSFWIFCHWFAHIIAIFIAIIRAIIPLHSSINIVPKLLVEVHGHVVARPHKQVDKVSIMLLGRHFFQISHECFGEALSTELGGDSDRRNMTMPIFNHIVVFTTFNFAQEVALYVALCVLTNDTVLRPLAAVFSVELGVECLSK